MCVTRPAISWPVSRRATIHCYGSFALRGSGRNSSWRTDPPLSDTRRAKPSAPWILQPAPVLRTERHGEQILAHRPRKACLGKPPADSSGSPISQAYGTSRFSTAARASARRGWVKARGAG